MHEINLLPPSRRSRLKQEWFRRTALQFLQHLNVAVGILAILGVITGGTLQLVLFLSTSSGDITLTQLISQYQNSRQEISEKNRLLEEVAQAGENRIIWSDNLSELFAALPPGTTIKDLQVTKNPIKLVFSGKSVNRNSLIILQTRLEQFAWAKEVSSPLQNLLARDNPEYSFSITIGEVK